MNNSNQANQSEENTGELVNMYFKEAWTNNTKCYLVYTAWTFGQMMDALSRFIARDFHIEYCILRIVPFGQPKGEKGDSIDIYGPLASVPIREYWNSTLNMGFYVKQADDIPWHSDDE
jgi:hypothetical protein